MNAEPGIDQIRREWEERARSPYRDFFVASHRGWQDADAWRHQAEVDVGHLLTRLPIDHPEGLGAVPYTELDVLEIGCGVGRLAAVLAPRLRSYVGFDLSPSMVARARVDAAPKCSFWVNDGLTFPAEIGDRRFGLVFALAVFIHCPKFVCAALLAEARRVLAEGGQFRGHFLCDQSDLEGFSPPPQTTARRSRSNRSLRRRSSAVTSKKRPRIFSSEPPTPGTCSVSVNCER